jgi:hypothetical protein
VLVALGLALALWLLSLSPRCVTFGGGSLQSSSTTTQHCVHKVSAVQEAKAYNLKRLTKKSGNGLFTQHKNNHRLSQHVKGDINEKVSHAIFCFSHGPHYGSIGDHNIY